MGLPGPHPRPRIHPPDRPGSLQRRLHGQLGQQRLSRHPRPHLRPALRAGLPPRAGRGREPGQARAGGHLPAQARGRRPQGRHPLAPADRGAAQRQARGLRRRRAGIADGGARPGAAGLPRHRVRRRGQGRRLHVDADPALPPARKRDRRRDRLHHRHAACAVRVGPAHRVDEGAAGRGLRRGLRRLRRAARPRPGHPRAQGSGRQHPHRHRLAGLGVLRPRDGRQAACHRARRRQHRDGLLPLGAAPGLQRRQGHRAQRLRGDEGLALGEGRCHARGHPDHQLPRAQGLRARGRQAGRHELRDRRAGVRRQGPAQPQAHRRARGLLRLRRGADRRRPGERLPLDRARCRHRRSTSGVCRR